MLIGEIVAKTGLSKDTIRFYEKAGLITLPKKARRANNYKEYPEGILKKLSVIQKLKGFGFTLNEVAEMISLYEEDLLTCSDNIPKVKEKIRVIDQKIKELKEVKSLLQECIAHCPTNCQVEATLSVLRN